MVNLLRELEMFRSVSVIIMVGLLAGCAANSAATPRPRAAVEIQAKDLSVVTGKLAQICDRNGLRIDNTSSNSVTCSRDGGLAAQILLGTRYGSGVRQRLQFSVFSTGNGMIKVAPELWMENQTAFGQVQRTDLNNDDNQGSVQGMLNTAKAEIEGSH